MRECLDNTCFALLWKASPAKYLQRPTAAFSNYVEVKDPKGMHEEMHILGLFLQGNCFFDDLRTFKLLRLLLQSVLCELEC